MSNSKAIGVKLLSREFQVNCPAGAEVQLLEAVEHLDQKMCKIRSSGRVIGIERIAIIAALNITNELLSFKRQKETYVQTVTEQIECLQNKIDDALMK